MNDIKKPDISISIVNYNSFDHLRNCLNTISNYSRNFDIEILIVDNDSKVFDPSMIYQIWPDAIITQNKNNLGFAFAQNQNFKLANGNYFLILNPDTLITKGSLHAMLDIFYCFDEAAVVAPNLITTEGKNIVTIKEMPTIKSAFFELLFINSFFSFFYKKKINGGHFDKEEFREVDCIDGAAFMVRSKIYDLLNGLDERFFMYFEEVDFCKRLKEIGAKMYFLPSVNVYHLYGKSTIGTDVRQTIYYESYYKYFRKHYGMFAAIAIRILIFLGEIIRFFGIQIKYFPFATGLSLYCKKSVISINLMFWALGVKSSFKPNNM